MLRERAHRERAARRLRRLIGGGLPVGLEHHDRRPVGELLQTAAVGPDRALQLLVARSRSRILRAIQLKLDDTGPLLHGEDERLARTVPSLIRRTDFDATAFHGWHSIYPGRQKALWQAPKLDLEEFALLQNAKHLLTSLYTLLAQAKEPTPAVVAAREDLLATLAQL